MDLNGKADWVQPFDCGDRTGRESPTQGSIRGVAPLAGSAGGLARPTASVLKVKRYKLYGKLRQLSGPHRAGRLRAPVNVMLVHLNNVSVKQGKLHVEAGVTQVGAGTAALQTS